jgi:hypothetical protein
MKKLTSKIKLFIKSILAINLTGKIIILLLVSLLIYQHFHYKIIVSEREEYFESYLDDLEYNFNDVENAMSDLISEVDDFNYENWGSNVDDVRNFADELESQISDFASSITGNYSYSGYGGIRIR